MKIVVATGGFDPVHSGHIKYLNAAAKLGDLLLVGINSDEWLQRKKGKEFLSFYERSFIIKNLKSVNLTFGFDDADGSAKDAIRHARSFYLNDTIIFVNGGDRTNTNIPEMGVEDSNLEFVFGVGGEDKANSSSLILKGWAEK